MPHCRPQLEAGENVVLLANHQTEADPGVFAHMLMSIHPRMAEEVGWATLGEGVALSGSEAVKLGRLR